MENEINSRDFVIEEHKVPSKMKDSMRESKQNFLKNPKSNRYDDITPDIFNIKNPHAQKNSSNNNLHQSKNVQLDPMVLPKKQNMTTGIGGLGQNLIVINRKEQKKYEDLLKNSHNVNYEFATSQNNANNVSQPYSLNKIKAGKVILDPINSNPFNQSKKNFYQNGPLGANLGNNLNGNKKIEVSFKATMQFTDQNGINNKIEISPNINLNNPNIVNMNQNKKTRLGKISEARFKDDLEFEDEN